MHLRSTAQTHSQIYSATGLPGLFEASMMTSDNVRLDADVWMPPGPGQFPVLLMRQAYGRRIGSALCYAHPAWYAQRGFMVVVQDVRGRGTSDGIFSAFETEARDGAEAVEWAAGLPGSNGRVGMYGFSYQGTNQLLAAARGPQALRAIAPAMIGWDLYADWATEDGAFRLASNLGWGIQMAAETARHNGETLAWSELYTASRNLPIDSAVNNRPPALQRWGNLGHYRDWLERPASDPYWQSISPSASLSELARSKVPALFVSGWFDTHLQGTLAAYRELQHAGNATSRLVVGPWTHFPWDRQVGDLDFGPDAVSPIDEMQLRWFNHWLKDDAPCDSDLPSLNLFDMGVRRWNAYDQWPQAKLDLHLNGSGLASINIEDGVIEEEMPSSASINYLVHDPWRPAPSFGGAFGTPPGPIDRAKIDARSDILVFTTRSFETALGLVGDIVLDLNVVCDGPAFDIACVLSRMDQDRRIFQIAEGFHSSCDHEPSRRSQISMRATCATIGPGDRLRLSIAAAAFPAYPVNAGDGRAPAETPRADCRVITVGIVTGGPDGSMLKLSLSNENKS